MDDAKKHAGGRPPSYKPEYCDQLVQHMSEGRSFQTFAVKVKTHSDTLYNWCKAYPEFLEAKKIGTMQSLKFFEDKMLHGLVAPKEFNTNLWIFCMKNRFGWHNNDQTKVSIEPPKEDKSDQVKDVANELVNVALAQFKKSTETK